jgi:small-conductance mechanosensitive channel
MHDFFYYQILVLTPFISIKLINLFIWMVLYYMARFCRVALTRFVRKKNIGQQQITLVGRDITLISLAKQLVNILFLVLALQSLSFTNNGNGLRELLDITLFEAGKFKLTVFNIFMLVILVVTAKLINTFARLFIHRTLAGKQWIDKGKEYTIVLIVQYFIYAIFTILIVRSFGVDLTLLVASSAALFVALGLGIQKIFADVISGFIILFEGSIKVGDIVEISEGQARIIQINIRTSKARTAEGNVVIIPNSKLTTERVNHWSFNNKSVRYSISVQVARKHEVARVRQLLYDCALSHKNVDKRKNVLILMEGISPKANQFKLCFWTDKIWEIEMIKSDLRFALCDIFEQQGFEAWIPVEKKEKEEKTKTEHTTN